MKFFRRLIVSALALLLSFPVLPQSYPTTNPTYVPNAILGATTLTAAGTVVFQNNGNAEILLRIAGTNTGFAATVEVTESRAASPTWTAISVQGTGGLRTASLTANGLYSFTSAGYAQVRLNVTSITGTNVIATWSGTLGGPNFVRTLPTVRKNYAAAITSATVAASATDFLTLSGNASTTIRITSVRCTGTATQSGTTVLVAALRNTANSGGGSNNSQPSVVKLDTNAPSSSSSPVQYITNPTTGSLYGNLRSEILSLPATTVAAQPLVWLFGQAPGDDEVVLRGVAQTFALNGNGATFPTGHSLHCNIGWSEE